MEIHVQKVSVKELVQNKNKVRFNFYRAGHFWYNVSNGSDVYSFPIPAEDIGNATLLAEDKAITFMRWIRKAIADSTLIHVYAR